MRNFVVKNDYNRSSRHRDKKNDYSRQWSVEEELYDETLNLKGKDNDDSNSHAQNDVE